MIGRLKGVLIHKSPPWLVVDVHGVGYELEAPMSTFYDLPVSEYAARQVKLAVVGTGGADKAQVQHMVGLMLSLQGKLQADAADALAVAITHAHVRASANRLGVDARAAWGRR